MYYIWEQDWRLTAVTDIKVPEAWEYYGLLSGEVIDIKLPPLELLMPSLEEIPDALVNQWEYLVFGPKLRDTIAKLTRDGIQYLPAIVKDEATGETLSDYLVANLLVNIPAIDRKGSALEIADGMIFAIDRLVLDASRVGDHSLFRLQEFASLVVVREDVADGIAQSKCSGMQFLPVNKLRV